MVPAAAVHDGAVFVVLDGRAVRRPVKTGATSSQGVRIEQGLIGGEDVIVNPPADLKDGDKVTPEGIRSNMSETIIETRNLTQGIRARRVPRGGAEGRDI